MTLTMKGPAAVAGPFIYQTHFYAASFTRILSSNSRKEDRFIFHHFCLAIMTTRDELMGIVGTARRAGLDMDGVWGQMGGGAVNK